MRNSAVKPIAAHPLESICGIVHLDSLGVEADLSGMSPHVIDVEWRIVSDAPTPSVFVVPPKPGWRVVFRWPSMFGEITADDAETLRWTGATFSKILGVFLVLSLIFGAMARL